MIIVFVNEQMFWEQMKLFFNNGFVQKKIRTMDEQLESRREIKNHCILKRMKKKKL